MHTRQTVCFQNVQHKQIAQAIRRFCFWPKDDCANANYFTTSAQVIFRSLSTRRVNINNHHSQICTQTYRAFRVQCNTHYVVHPSWCAPPYLLCSRLVVLSYHGNGFTIPYPIEDVSLLLRVFAECQRLSSSMMMVV